jgi:hypothetical protein
VIAGDDMSISSLLFNLDGGVENAVLIALAESIDVSDSFVAEVRTHMAGKYVFPSGQGPAVKVM